MENNKNGHIWSLQVAIRWNMPDSLAETPSEDAEGVGVQDLSVADSDPEALR
ncbi:hypothetical protein ACLB1Q_34945 [Escherichia coli]